jgi:NTE family protein
MAFESLRRILNGERASDARPGTPAAAVRRPTIGLALGSGGARGFAHIGVIRALNAHGIIPDVIVGTSIGAVAGGCHAAGRLDVFEEWGRGLTRRGLLNYLDLNVSGSGLITGDKLAARLKDALGGALVDRLPARFATIATEVGTGHEIWLTRGRLVDAVRASYALPGIFPPVELDGRWLVDGALVNPVPVSAARVLGARLVIAVNLNSDVLGRSITLAGERHDPIDEPAAQDSTHTQRGLRGMFGSGRALKRQFAGGARRPGVPTLMVDAFNIMQDRITRARLAGDPPDVMISPRLGQIGWFDFHRAQEAIDIGARAAERALEQIDDAISALSPRPASLSPTDK